jgi:hypothetical protein
MCGRVSRLPGERQAAMTRRITELRRSRRPLSKSWPRYANSYRSVRRGRPRAPRFGGIASAAARSASRARSMRLRSRTAPPPTASSRLRRQVRLRGRESPTVTTLLCDVSRLPPVTVTSSAKLLGNTACANRSIWHCSLPVRRPRPPARDAAASRNPHVTET